MTQKKRFLMLLVVLFSVALAAMFAEAAEAFKYPASWYAPYKTASQMGITKFNQSPYLDQAVAKGELPPVKDRLPVDPPVIEPIENIGKYGGRAIGGAGMFGNYAENLFICDPDFSDKILPNIVRDYLWTADRKTLTIFLRKGLKWSDGVPYTAEEMVFWWKYIFPDPELNPCYEGKTIIDRVSNVRKIDDWTVVFEFSEPNPFFINIHATLGGEDWWWAFNPSHYLKQFYAFSRDDADRLTKMAKDEGMETWRQLFNKKRQRAGDPKKEQLMPTLMPYMCKEKGPNWVLYVRNPYYFQVDPAGNQLPYIDEIYEESMPSAETADMKLLAGELSSGSTALKNLPTFQANAQKGDYRIYLYPNNYGSQCALFFNLTESDPVLRKIFNDIDFRRAVSLSIDRNAINKTLYLGVAKVSNAIIMDSSKTFEPWMTTDYAQYDPTAANKLLDAIGLVDKNKDGVRERPDGKPLQIFFETYTDEHILMIEMMSEMWKKVGLNITLKTEARELYRERAVSNMVQMTANYTQGNDAPFQRAFRLIPGQMSEGDPFPLWTTWVSTGGKQGEEPTEDGKNLMKWFEIMSSSPSPSTRVEYEKKIVTFYTQNLWLIGVLNGVPTPIIVKNNLRNVPATAIIAWDNRWPEVCHPEQYYLEK